MLSERVSCSPTFESSINDNTMKTPYMNIKENQGFMIILVIVIAFLMLTSFNGKAQVYTAGINTAYVDTRTSEIPVTAARSFSITDQPVSMSESINSHFIELKPVMTPCGSRLYFSRLPYQAGLLKSRYDEDIWYTDYNAATNTWSEPKRLEGELNNSGPNFVNSISPKGDTLVLGNRYKKGKMYAGLSYSVKVDGQWSAPRNINIRKDYNTSDHANHFVSFQHHVIISAIERAETVGGRDLYVSLLDGDNATEPMNLGMVVNTGYEESSPYLSSDGKTLFFASQGHDGFGGFDIYMTTRLDDTWTNWSTPVNLGPAVNTAMDEEHFSLTRCGKFAMFSRALDNSNVDLFRVNIGTSLEQFNKQPLNVPFAISFASL